MRVAHFVSRCVFFAHRPFRIKKYQTKCRIDFLCWLEMLFFEGGANKYHWLTHSYKLYQEITHRTIIYHITNFKKENDYFCHKLKSHSYNTLKDRMLMSGEWFKRFGNDWRNAEMTILSNLCRFMSFLSCKLFPDY